MVQTCTTAVVSIARTGPRSHSTYACWTCRLQLTLACASQVGGGIGTLSLSTQYSTWFGDPAAGRHICYMDVYVSNDSPQRINGVRLRTCASDGSYTDSDLYGSPNPPAGGGHGWINTGGHANPINYIEARGCQPGVFSDGYVGLLRVGARDGGLSDQWGSDQGCDGGQFSLGNGLTKVNLWWKTSRLLGLSFEYNCDPYPPPSPPPPFPSPPPLP